jgi:hypothetical protein
MQVGCEDRIRAAGLKFASLRRYPSRNAGINRWCPADTISAHRIPGSSPEILLQRGKRFCAIQHRNENPNPQDNRNSKYEPAGLPRTCGRHTFSAFGKSSSSRCYAKHACTLSNATLTSVRLAIRDMLGLDKSGHAVGFGDPVPREPASTAGGGILVVKLNCELDQTRPASLRNLAKSGVETVPIGIKELRVVESIEGFGSKFQLL